jgi:hypothetical protein
MLEHPGRHRLLQLCVAVRSCDGISNRGWQLRSDA